LWYQNEAESLDGARGEYLRLRWLYDVDNKWVIAREAGGESSEGKEKVLQKS
jgi:hypothetical protein